MATATSSPALIGMEAADIAAFLGPAHPPYRARQIYRALYHERVSSVDRMTALPASLRGELAGIDFGLPAVNERYTSTDGTQRYLLGLADGRTVEAVHMPGESRDTLCISSQVGCPVDCKFCLTALMGLERSLTVAEIVGQVLVLAALNRLDPRERQVNVVMMGQGEPLLNLPNVLKATRILVDPQGVGLFERRLTVSTSGIIPRMAELGAAPVRPKLAISLNASTEEQRIELMPITRKYHLRDLIDACRAYPLRTWEHLTFEYVLLKGVNDSDADARRLVSLLGGLRCKVNLIAFNQGPGLPYETPTPERVEAFRAIVGHTVSCFVRQPRGRDIYAACGQLKLVSLDPKQLAAPQ